MIYGIRAKFGNYFIKRILSKSERKVQVVNLKKAKSAGILFKDTDELLLKKIEKFAEEISKKFDIKQLDILAYSTNKAKVKPAYYSKGKHTKFFFLKETTLFLKPKSDIVKSFLAKQHDILIDFSKNKYIPLSYVMAMSNAPFKVGRYDDKDQEFYDFMITMDDQKSDEDFFKQLMHYLTMINDNNEKK